MTLLHVIGGSPVCDHDQNLFQALQEKHCHRQEMKSSSICPIIYNSLITFDEQYGLTGIQVIMFLQEHARSKKSHATDSGRRQPRSVLHIVRYACKNG